MFDRFLDPDSEPLWVCSCKEADCAVCGHDWEGNLDTNEAKAIQIAEHNYECLVYNEVDRMTTRRLTW